MNTSKSMSTAKKDTSEKLNIIDRKTFENIQQSTKTETFRKVHNAKFRKKNAVKSGGAVVFNLMQFLTKPSKQTKKEKKYKKYTVCLYSDKAIKKRGKTREGGKRKKPTKLKKSILRYRLQKRQQQQEAECSTTADKNVELLNETLDQMSTLSLGLRDEKKQESFQNNVSQGIIKTFHSRRFRSYCDNCTTPLLAEFTEQLLRELDRFQKRALMQNPIKAHAHRRFVVGFREAQSFLLIKKVKLIIIAPDCEVCDGEDGLDMKINYIKDECRKQNVPYLFSLRRRQLAYALFKKAPVGCIAVLDYDGTRELFSKLMDELQKARKSYEELSFNYRDNHAIDECIEK